MFGRSTSKKLPTTGPLFKKSTNKKLNRTSRPPNGKLNNNIVSLKKENDELYKTLQALFTINEETLMNQDLLRQKNVGLNDKNVHLAGLLDTANKLNKETIPILLEFSQTQKSNIQKLMHIIETLCEYLIVHDEDGGNIKFKVNEYLHNRSKVLDLTT